MVEHPKSSQEPEGLQDSLQEQNLSPKQDGSRHGAANPGEQHMSPEDATQTSSERPIAVGYSTVVTGRAFRMGQLMNKIILKIVFSSNIKHLN